MNAHVADRLRETDHRAAAAFRTHLMSLPLDEVKAVLRQHCEADQPTSVLIILSTGRLGVNEPCGERGATALHTAAGAGSQRVLSALLGVGADPGVTDADGKTALFHAAGFGKENTAKALVQAAAWLRDASDAKGRTPLLAAAFGGHGDVVAALLRAGADVNGATPDGHTPLHAACTQGHARVVTQLLRAGADVEAVDAIHYSPTHTAAYFGHANVVKRLLAAGADPNRQDVLGNTPLVTAVLQRHANCVRALLSVTDVELMNGRGNNALHTTCVVGDVACFKLVLSKIRDVSTRTALPANPRGCTSAHLAAFRGFDAQLRLLLAAGVDSAVANSERSVALHYAASGGHLACVLLLCPPHAPPPPHVVNAKDALGRTPLAVAAVYGHVKCCAALLVAGADAHDMDADGNTPLALARLFHPTNAQLAELLDGVSSAEDELTCDACGARWGHLKVCPCQLALYCGPACQAAAWHAHSGACLHAREVREQLRAAALRRVVLQSVEPESETDEGEIS